MLQYLIHNNKLCVQGLKNLVGVNTWDNLRKRNGLQVVIPHAPGRSAVVSYESIRADIKERIKEVLGSPQAHAGVVVSRFVDTIKKDIDAFRYFSEKNLSREKVNRYTNDASILNAMITLELKHISMNRRGNTHIREAISNSETINDLFPNALPWSEKRLKLKYDGYKHGSYENLLHGGVGNKNRRKVDDKLERLIVFLKSRPHKPYDNEVVRMYENWLLGEYELYDNETGELLFDRKDFIKNDEFLTLTEQTVRNYVTKPANAAVIDKMTMTFHDFNNAQRPIAFRNNAIMSNSKLTMDDFDLPKCDQGFRPKAYGTFDIGSEALIGYSVSRKKDTALFEACMLNTMRFVHQNGLGMPAEVEVENHLVKEYFDVLQQMFTFMRICAPTNSREKRAERRIRAVKYENLKNEIIGVGRHYLRGKANRVDINRVNDEDIETMHPYDEVVASFKVAVEKYNNALHHRQDLYPGMSRMDVYLNNQNPNLKPYAPQVAAHYFGHSHYKPVNIYNNQYVKVANDCYMLPSPELMSYFANGKAYVNWLVEADGSVPEVYLYTNRNGTVNEQRDVTQEMYMCTCKRVERWTDAEIEKTDHDREVQLAQQKYASQFDKIVKEKQQDIRKISVVHTNSEAMEVPAVEVPQMDPLETVNVDFDTEYDADYDYEYQDDAVSRL